MNHSLLKKVITDQHQVIRESRIIPRPYEFEKNGNYVLTGIRRAGKSMLLYSIAQKLIEQRERSPLATTFDLVRVVDAAIPKVVRQKDEGHPARRTFQAVRIRINDELAPLSQALEDWVSLLRPGGRLCVITFHSLEDRIVKAKMKQAERPCTCPPSFPVCVCGKKSAGKVAGKPLRPGKEETESNPRAKSAKLRVFEKRSERYVTWQ